MLARTVFCLFLAPSRVVSEGKSKQNTLNDRFLFMKTSARGAFYRKMGTKTGIYKQKCSISWFLFIFEGKSARKMKMTGYYQFSQALSVAMPESSSAITISGVEPLPLKSSIFS